MILLHHSLSELMQKTPLNYLDLQSDFFPLVVKHTIDFPLTCCHLCKRGFNVISDMLISPLMKLSCATEHKVHACM